MRFNYKKWQHFLILIAVAVIVSVFFTFPPTSKNELLNYLHKDQQVEAATTPPNIVVIMTDDLDVRTLSTLQSLGLMPNLQNYIISKGTTFQNAFVNNSLCCPSRATFLTGQYSHNHNTYAVSLSEQGAGRFNDTSTLATWLHDSGYVTGLIGKYLNGYGVTNLNGDEVVDIQDLEYIPPGWDEWQVLLDPYVYRMYQYVMNENGTIKAYTTAENDYQTDVIAAKAATFIQNMNSNTAPFFLEVAPVAPHVEVWPNTPFKTYTDVWRLSVRPPARYIGTITTPLTPRTAYNESDISDKPPWVQSWPLMTAEDNYFNQELFRNRLAATRAVDDLIGTVVDALIESNKLNNTVLIFTSDNGFMYGEHRLSEKSYAFEESIRVPLYIAAPGFPQNKIAQSQLVVNTDLASTIADLANVVPKHTVDGTSVKPILANNTIPWRKRFLIEHQIGGNTVFDVPSYSGVRTSSAAQYVPNQKYIEYQDTANSKEFYDLTTDPAEMHSLQGDSSPTKVIQMSIHKQYLNYLKTCQGITCRYIEFINSSPSSTPVVPTITNIPTPSTPSSTSSFGFPEYIL
jgi:arylsulfatase A-like enzyme